MTFPMYGKIKMLQTTNQLFFSNGSFRYYGICNQQMGFKQPMGL
jgi:hypothetical protein